MKYPDRSVNVLRNILNSARWAPSGDNTQPWRFEILDETRVVAHCFDTRSHCVYDLDGRPSQIAIGAMLETLSIAASREQLGIHINRRRDMAETQPTFDIELVPADDVLPDPLEKVIERRSVQRRALRMRALSEAEKRALESAVGTDHRLVWIEPAADRLRVAHLMFDSAKLRLTMPEAYQVHRAVIEWNSRYSADRVPDQALGIDALTMRLMKFVMQSWRRVAFFNAFLAGTWLPRIQMDLLPGIACAAHFVLLAKRPATTLDDHVAAGRAVQRFWLQATRLRLELQPELTPLIFARYARDGRAFSTLPSASATAAALGRRLGVLVGEGNLPAAVFMGRLGAGRHARARSPRRPLDDLLTGGAAAFHAVPAPVAPRVAQQSAAASAAPASPLRR